MRYVGSVRAAMTMDHLDKSQALLAVRGLFTVDGVGGGASVTG